MKFTQAQIDELVAHANDDAPNECCGLIASKAGAAVEIVRATNAAASPLRYELDARDLLEFFKMIDERDLDVGAVYHSHTRSAAVPSQTDINLALYPDSLYIIISIAIPGSPEVRAYRIVDRKVDEIALEIN